MLKPLARSLKSQLTSLTEQMVVVQRSAEQLWQRPQRFTIKVDRFAHNPIITTALGEGVGKSINGPSLIRVPDWLPHPLGEYYLYFAHHRGKSIRLAYADRLEGPWLLYEPATLKLEETPANDHIASPDVHVDHARKEIRMYYHGRVSKGVQKTFAARSLDGIHFTSHPEVLGSYYFRVFEWQGYHYAFAKEAPIYRSVDGFYPFTAGPRLYDDSFRHCAVKVVADQLYVFYSRIGDAPERILFATVDLNEDWTSWKLSPPVTILKPERSYEGAGLPLKPSRKGPPADFARVCELRDPCIFSEDGQDYLLYSVAGENGIAIASLQIEPP